MGIDRWLLAIFYQLIAILIIATLITVALIVTTLITATLTKIFQGSSSYMAFKVPLVDDPIGIINQPSITLSAYE